MYKTLARDSKYYKLETIYTTKNVSKKKTLSLLPRGSSPIENLISTTGE